MRIMIVGSTVEARAAVAGHLACFAQVISVNFDAGLAQIKHQVPEVLVFMLSDTGAAADLRRLCAADPTGGMYVLTIVPENHHVRARSSAFAAGSHDVMASPYSPQELRARVDVHRRLRRWVATKRAPAPKTTEPPGLNAWECLDDVVADSFEAMLGRPLSVGEGWPDDTQPLQLASISVALAAAQLEFSISIVADPASGRWLGENLLCDPDASAAMLDDVLRELANVAAGAFKLAALSEGPVLSIGIPTDCRTLPERASDARCWTMLLDDGAKLAVIAEIRQRANRRVPARRLVEGMVVVNDIRNPAGLLLLPAGSRLTATTAEKLRGVLDLTMIEVASA